MLVEGGYVITNAHVVWPFDEVRVVFPDGDEFLGAPVLAWDLMSDLAVIGPLDTNDTGLSLVDGEDLGIGSDVFLIGYPGELEEFPQPTLTRGLISRLREWDANETTYFQTDTAVAGGQSGGALVSANGAVIGISGMAFTEAGFALSASATDVRPRVEALIGGTDVPGLGNPLIPRIGGRQQHQFSLDNYWQASTYVIIEPAGTNVEIEVESENDVGFAIIDVFGQFAANTDAGTTGIESGSAVTLLDAPYFLIVYQFTDAPGNFQVSSNRDLIPYIDTDDDTEITTGETLAGSMDIPGGETDVFLIDLEEGDVVEITVDSLNFDPYVSMSSSEENGAFDDDSGGGLLGTNAHLVYRAPHTGTFVIAIGDSVPVNGFFGGYFLTVIEASAEAIATLP